MDRGEKLEELKKKYEATCKEQRRTLTYRGLLSWLKEEGLIINYHEGMDFGLLDFNNRLYDEIEGKSE